MNTDQDGLFHESLGMLDPRPYEPADRVRLLDRDYHAVMAQNDGTYWLTGGPETTIPWEATLDTFATGVWVAAIVCGQATCERTLASLMHTWYTIRPEPKGWRTWGLGRLINHLGEQEMVNPALLTQVQHLCDMRKPYGRWRDPMREGSLARVALDAYRRGTGETPEEAQERHVAQLAFLAVRTALRVHFGDLSRALATSG